MAKKHSALTGADLHNPKGMGVENTTQILAVTQSVNKVNLSGSFLPTNDVSFDLGSATKAWKDVYVSSGSIKFINPADNSVLQTLTADSNGVSFGGGDVSGSVISGSKLHVVGDTFIGGTLTLGDADTDTIKVVAEYSGSMIPDVDDAFDLGETGKEWKDLHIDGTANIDSLAVTDAFTYGSTTWNENAGALSVTGSDFFFKSTGGGLDVYDNSDALMFKIENKMVVLGAKTTTPTATAGGMFYSGSDEWFFGYSSDPS
jgi:hypothetical protein|tara:strand:- start:150 stop:926 length:777 start_codon:yes stop_codon:yes gene_type:complete